LIGWFVLVFAVAQYRALQRLMACIVARDSAGIVSKCFANGPLARTKITVVMFSKNAPLRVWRVTKNCPMRMAENMP
jgi:hypothetical protein